MELKFEKKTLRNIAFCCICIVIVYWLLHDADRVKSVLGGIMSVFSPFIVGAVLAFILNVPMRAFEKLLSGVKNNSLRRILALLLSLLCVALVIAILFMLLIPELIETINSIEPKLIEFFKSIGLKLDAFLTQYPEVRTWIMTNMNLKDFNWGSVAQKIIDLVGSGLNTLFLQAVSVIGSLVSGVMSAFISIAFAIYSLFQKEALARQGRKLIYAFLPEHISDYIVRVLRLSNSTFSNFLSGQCVEVCILGCMFAIAMAIFRMPYIPLVSVLVAVTAFIPVVGAWIGCIVGAFLILVSNPIQAVWFVIMFLILQQLENNLIYPRVVGTSIGLSGMWVLIAVAVGGELMGVAGMFLMIPFVSVLYTLIREWINKRVSERAIEPEKLTAQPPELRSHFQEKRERQRRKLELKKLARLSLKHKQQDK